MPSNKDLKAAIWVAATEAGVEAPDLNGKGNNDLVAILDKLLKPVDEVAPPPPEVDEVEKPPFYVADGRSVTCKKGIRGPGDSIESEWFHGGEKDLKHLIEIGCVIKS